MFIYLAAVSLAAFVLYGIDKYKARRGLWRIPESMLLFAAAAGGMYVFHHKTKKPRFFIGVPVMLLLHLVILYFSCPVFFP